MAVAQMLLLAPEQEVLVCVAVEVRVMQSVGIGYGPLVPVPAGREVPYDGFAVVTMSVPVLQELP